MYDRTSRSSKYLQWVDCRLHCTYNRSDDISETVRNFKPFNMLAEHKNSDKQLIVHFKVGLWNVMSEFVC